MKETPDGLFIKVLDKYTNRKYWFDPEKYRNKIMPPEIMRIITRYTIYTSIIWYSLKNLYSCDRVLAIIPHRSKKDKFIYLFLTNIQKVHNTKLICDCIDLDDKKNYEFRVNEYANCFEIMIHKDRICFYWDYCKGVAYHQLYLK